MRVYGRGFGSSIQFQIVLVSRQTQVQMDWSFTLLPNYSLMEQLSWKLGGCAVQGEWTMHKNLFRAC